MGLGAVCHTLNPRLFEADLIYIIDHAQGGWLCAATQGWSTWAEAGGQSGKEECLSRGAASRRP